VNWKALGVALTALIASTACVRHSSSPPSTDLDAAAESYVRLVLALGERDADSLDRYHGPAAWQAAAHQRQAALVDVQRDARALADTLAPATFRGDDEIRRAFLVRQLRAVVARIDILRGERPRFADESRRVFDLDADASAADVAPIYAALDRELPGRGTLAARFAAFDRTFLIAPDRLPQVMARAIERCRFVTRAHVALPSEERADTEYVRDLPWSAFTRYHGGFRSTIRINTALPLTVDRALDLACHEAYPGHHTIDSLLEQRFGASRVELLVQPTFSPQSALHESAASGASSLVFGDADRVAFERDVLFPLAGLNPTGAERHVRVSRLVDRLHGVEATIARRYLDGELDFPRASLALERDALMPSADATLKFLNQYRSYAATYTIGRDRFWQRVIEMTNEDDLEARWRAYVDLVTGAWLPPGTAMALPRTVK
jgi:hypothetical protein